LLKETVNQLTFLTFNHLTPTLYSISGTSKLLFL